jgi:hypothetical protein
LKIYSGSTVTSTPIHTQAQPATAVNAGEFLRVYLTVPIAVNAFSQYTFELPLSLEIPYSGGNPYPGGRMFYNGTNASLYANSDIRFNASVVNNCTPTASSLIASACQSFLSPSGLQWTNSGQYTDTIANAQGCDSVISIDLTIIDLDTAVTVSGLQLTAVETGADYAWINCDNNLPVPGEDQQSFTPTTSGSYAVVVSRDGCSEQGSCVFVGITAVNERDFTTVRARPGNGPDQWVLDGLPADARVAVFDATGRSIPVERNGPVLELRARAPGLHLLRMQWSNGQVRVLRVVEH